MGKPLQTRIVSFLFFLTSFSLLSTAQSVQAQLLIQDERGFEVVFSRTDSQYQKQQVRLGPDDINSLYARSSTQRIGDWDTGYPDGELFYVTDAYGNLGVGGMKPADSGAQTLSMLSFRNGTDSAFESMELIFDLFYHPSADIDYTLELYYRIENGEWQSVPGASISRSVLREQSSDSGWNSISIQTAINNIILTPDETIGLEWRIRSQEAPSEALPIAFHQIEALPGVFEPEPLERGDLIFTEILPSGGPGQPAEFIELFNPTDRPLNLKGVEIRTHQGAVVIRENFRIAPYSFGVIAGEHTDLGDQDQRIARYRYTGEIVGGRSGYAELYHNGNEIAKATYEQQQPGVSMELDRAANAFDGYTSMHNLLPSAERGGRNLQASPGRAGQTERMFIKEISGEGWHLLSAPGLLDTRMSRFARMNVLPVRDDVAGFNDYRSREPVMVYLEAGEQIRAFSGEEGGVPAAVSVPLDGTGSRMITLPDAAGRTLSDIRDRSGNVISPAYLQWNPRRQNFELQYDPVEPIGNWTPLVVNESVAEPSFEDAGTAIGQSMELSRYLRIGVYEQGERRRQLDEAVIGFLRQPAGDEGARYDLPKLLPLVHERDDLLNRVFLHLGGHAETAGSFTHLPFEISENHSVNVGVSNTGSAKQAVLEWSQMEDIPEEWVLTLTDRVTGSEINMREQNRYEFRLNRTDEFMESQRVQEGVISVLNSPEEERFVITMKPYEEMSVTETESERPASVELRQNYPNPFNPATNIVFYLPEERPVKVGIYNIVGQQVALLAEEVMGAGEHTITWNAADMPSGIYIVQLEAGNRAFTRKITLIK